MANYPGINLTIKDTALGTFTAPNDGIAGLIVADDLSQATENPVADGDEFTLNEYSDIEGTGLDEISFIDRQVALFYNEAGAGKKLIVKAVENYDSDATEENTMDLICDKTHADAYLKNFIENNNGIIKMVGICHNPSENHTLNTTNGFDDTAYAALGKADTYAIDARDSFYPFFALIEGRAYQGVPGDLTDLSAETYNHVGCVIGHSEKADSSGTSDLSAAVGLVLGRAANVSVEQKVSATEDGSLSVTTMYVPDSDGNSQNVKQHDVETISTKNYVTFRSFIGQNGYYIADDPLANSSDFNNITNRRVMDKIIRIAYDTYFNSLSSSVEINEDGQIAAGVIKNLQEKIENRVGTAMVGEGELSDFSSYIDPSQNVLSTGKLDIKLQPTPLGYLKEIELIIGFDNPQT
jgi:hypothetical protein